MKKNLSFIVSTVLLIAPVNVLADMVSKSDFKGVWPLTVEKGTLSCSNNAITFATTDGKVYAVNGAAKGKRAQPIDPIWANNPELPGVKLSLSGLIEKGLSLCDKTTSNETVQAPPTDNATRNWYEGGTLHGGTGKDWRTATDSNRLATSADIVAKMNTTGKLTFTVQGIDDLKPYAIGLSTCLTEFLKTKQTDTQLVADSAIMCMITMKWFK